MIRSIVGCLFICCMLANVNAVSCPANQFVRGGSCIDCLSAADSTQCGECPIYKWKVDRCTICSSMLDMVSCQTCPNDKWRWQVDECVFIGCSLKLTTSAECDLCIDTIWFSSTSSCQSCYNAANSNDCGSKNCLDNWYWREAQHLCQPKSCTSTSPLCYYCYDLFLGPDDQCVPCSMADENYCNVGSSCTNRNWYAPQKQCQPSNVDCRLEGKTVCQQEDMCGYYQWDGTKCVVSMCQRAPQKLCKFCDNYLWDPIWKCTACYLANSKEMCENAECRTNWMWDSNNLQCIVKDCNANQDICSFCPLHSWDVFQSTLSCLSCSLVSEDSCKKPSCSHVFTWEPVTASCLMKYCDSASIDLCPYCPDHIWHEAIPVDVCSVCSDMTKAQLCGSDPCSRNWIWSSEDSACLVKVCNQYSSKIQCSHCPYHHWYESSMDKGCLTCSQLQTSESCSTCPEAFWAPTLNPDYPCIQCYKAPTQQDCNIPSCSTNWEWSETDNTCNPKTCTSTSSFFACTYCIDVYWNRKTNKCDPCSSASKAKCGTCQNWVWDTSLGCIKKCSGSNVDSTAQPYQKDGACLCQAEYVYDKTLQKCKKCSDPSITRFQCGSNSCKEYFIIDGKCGSCGELGASQGSKVIAKPGEIALNGVCTCEEYFYWKISTHTCDSCSNADASICATGTCIKYFLKGSTCTMCPAHMGVRTSTTLKTVCQCEIGYEWSAELSNCVFCDMNNCGTGICSNYFLKDSVFCTKCPTAHVVVRTVSTPRTECECQSGYPWSSITFDCGACDFTKSFINPKTGLCQACNSIPNGATVVPGNTAICKCKSNYTFINGGCSCDASKLLFDIGNEIGCGGCSSLIGGVNNNLTTKGCNCVAGAVWNEFLGRCRCPNILDYVTKNGCVSCSMLGIGLTYGGDLYNPEKCTCTDDYVWSLAYKTCVCKKANQIYINKDNIDCVSCGSTFHSLNAADGPSACVCPLNMVWNIAKGGCICNSWSVPKSTNALLGCFSCQNISGGTGVRLNSSICGCNAGWSWSGLQLACVCKTRTCTCPSGYILGPLNICIPCSQIAGSTAFSQTNIACKCKQSFVWKNDTFKCLCPSNALSIPYKGICRFCDIFSNAYASDSISPCKCIPNHVWSSTDAMCVFVSTQSTKNTVMHPNGTLYSCQGLGGSTGVSLDNFNCRCASGFVWRDFTLECIACSSIANSTGATFGATACVCQQSFYWDILSFTCRPNICQYDRLDARCTTCSYAMKEVKLVPRLIVITSQEKTVFLTDDAVFAQAAALASANYTINTPFKCLCTSGFTWNIARRRCFKTSVNSTY